MISSAHSTCSLVPKLVCSLVLRPFPQYTHQNATGSLLDLLKIECLQVDRCMISE